MSTPRAHHYLPVFYLRNFCNHKILESQGKEVLWVYEKNKTPRKSTPKNEAHRRDFYSHERGSIEKGLSESEGVAGPIIDKVCTQHTRFTRNEKAEMAVFVGLMFHRGPSGRAFLNKLAGEALKLLSQGDARDENRFREAYKEFTKHQNVPYVEAEMQRLREVLQKGEFEFEQMSPGFNLRMMLDAARDTGLVLETLNWQILWTDYSVPFLTSDNPVVSVQPGADERATIGVGFGLPGVEVYFPLSTRTCLMMSNDLEEGIFEARSRRVRQINRVLMSCAGRNTYASCSSPKLKKLFDRVGCRVTYGKDAFVPPWMQAKKEGS